MLLTEAGLQPVHQEAYAHVLHHAVLEAALQQTTAHNEAFIAMVVRAVVAQMSVLAEEHGVPSIPGDKRDALVDRIVAELDGSARAIMGWVLLSCLPLETR